MFTNFKGSFDDKLSGDYFYDRDNNLYDTDKGIDWSLSELVWIHGCEEMTLDLDDDDNSIQKTIENSVLLVENMTELSITTFQVGLRNDDLKGVSFFK